MLKALELSASNSRTGSAVGWSGWLVVKNLHPGMKASHFLHCGIWKGGLMKKERY